jgi:hypothetical protein
MRRIGLAALAILALAAPARADDDESKGEPGRPAEKGTFGIGIILGEPTGVSAKLYLSDDQAIQAALGSAFISGGLQIDADYLFHPWILQDQDSFVMPVYLGPGVRVIDYEGSATGNHLAPGLRAVIGILFDFKTVPIDAFVEVAGVAGYDFGKKKFDPALNAGAGVRYYF